MMTHPRGLVVAAVIELVLGGYLCIMGYQDMWEEVRIGRPHRAATAHRAAARPRAAKASRARTSKRPRRRSR
jgi:hypothetical protein